MLATDHSHGCAGLVAGLSNFRFVLFVELRHALLSWDFCTKFGCGSVVVLLVMAAVWYSSEHGVSQCTAAVQLGVHGNFRARSEWSMSTAVGIRLIIAKT